MSELIPGPRHGQCECRPPTSDMWVGDLWVCDHGRGWLKESPTGTREASPGEIFGSRVAAGLRNLFRQGVEASE